MLTMIHVSFTWVHVSIEITPWLLYFNISLTSREACFRKCFTNTSLCSDQNRKSSLFWPQCPTCGTWHSSAVSGSSDSSKSLDCRNDAFSIWNYNKDNSKSHRKTSFVHMEKVFNTKKHHLGHMTHKKLPPALKRRCSHIWDWDASKCFQLGLIICFPQLFLSAADYFEWKCLNKYLLHVFSLKFHDFIGKKKAFKSSFLVFCLCPSMMKAQTAGASAPLVVKAGTWCSLTPQTRCAKTMTSFRPAASNTSARSWIWRKTTALWVRQEKKQRPSACCCAESREIFTLWY